MSGPSHPSCSPRTYSFQVCRPITISPRGPLNSVIPEFVRIASTTSSSPLCSGGNLLFLIFSASSARISPSFRPCINSQSNPEATRIGFTYSLKCSCAVLRPSLGGPSRNTDSFLGIAFGSRGSFATCSTNLHHFLCTRLVSLLS